MSWSYSGNPASSKIDELRFATGDTNQSDPIMQDEELGYLIATYGDNHNLLMYQAFVHVATIFARDIKRTLGPQSEDPTERLKFFKQQTDFYQAKLAKTGISLPIYAYPKTFRKGMQSNPPAKTGGDYLV